MNTILPRTIAVAITFSLLCSISFAQSKFDKPYNLQKAYEVLRTEADEEQALGLLADQLNQTPDNAECYFLRARIMMNRKEYGAAISDLNTALRVNKPTKSGMFNYTFHWWKAVVYEKMGEYQSAINCYTTALPLARKADKKAVHDLLFGYGNALYQIKDYDGSDSVFNLILKGEESDVVAMIGLARNLIAREQYKDAVNLLDKAQKLSPEHGLVYKYRMSAFDKLREGDKAIDDALRWYDKEDECSTEDIMAVLVSHKTYSIAKIKTMMKESDSPVKWHVLIARLYGESHDYVMVIKEYDLIEREFGKDERIFLARSSAYSDLGMTEKALRELDKALEICDDSYNRSARADILRRAGRYDEAIADCLEIIEMQPDAAFGYYMLGWCNELNGDEDKAMEAYCTGIDLDKSYPYIFLMRGTLYHKRGDEASARKDFERVIEIDTTASGCTCRMYALHFLGRDEEALEWMQKTIDNAPNGAGNLYDKACLLSRMGRLDESVVALGQALEMGFSAFEHIKHDDDMDPIRDREDFQSLVANYEEALRENVEKSGLDDVPLLEEEQITEVAISRHAGGTFDVQCEVNGLSLNMIFDTGASDVTISKVEADFMFKNKYLAKEDIRGKRYYQIADGGISEGTVITLKEVKIGDAVLRNVDASVVKSQQAPLLLGESTLQKFGTFTIDNINSKLIIKH